MIIILNVDLNKRVQGEGTHPERVPLVRLVARYARDYWSLLYAWICVDKTPINNVYVEFHLFMRLYNSGIN